MEVTLTAKKLTDLPDTDLKKAVSNDGDNVKTNKDLPKSSKGMKFQKIYILFLGSLIYTVFLNFGSSSIAGVLDNDHDLYATIPPDTDVELTGTLPLIGVFTLGMAAGNLAQLLGHPDATIISTLPFIIGWSLTTFPKSGPYIYPGRIFIALSCGLFSIKSPVYFVEIATSTSKVLLGTYFQFFAIVCALLAFALKSVISWEWLSVFGCVFSVTSLIINLFVKKLIKKCTSKSKSEKMFWIQDDFHYSSEMYKSAQEDTNSQLPGIFNIRELITLNVRKLTLLSFILIFFSQINGLSAILFYVLDMLNDVHNSARNTFFTILIVVIGQGSSFLNSIRSDRDSKKMFCLMSGICITFSLIIFGTYITTKKYGWLPLLSLIVFNEVFSIAIIPIVWLLNGEMTTARLRIIINGIAIALNWTCVFAITGLFLTIHNHPNRYNDYRIYWFYGSICLLSCIFTTFLLPEIKENTSTELQTVYTVEHSVLISETAKNDIITKDDKIHNECNKS